MGEPNPERGQRAHEGITQELWGALDKMVKAYRPIKEPEPGQFIQGLAYNRAKKALAAGHLCCRKRGEP